MPREIKKRGRRAEKQRKDGNEDASRPVKRQKTSDYYADQENFEVSGNAGDDFISFGDVQDNDFGKQDEESTGYANTFYGLLTEEEQEYYTNVNNKINADDFESDEDRSAFIEAVYRESTGKEIKIASSQSCSRYLEKIIGLSTQSQLQTLFQAFLQDLIYLVQHRFGSHCVETLFTKSVTFVHAKGDRGNEQASFETLFLEATGKLQENIGFLLTERFASHSVRVLLLVLSGEPLADTSATTVVASRKKEKQDAQKQDDSVLSSKRKVPHSFSQALSGLIKTAVSSFDATYLRALATQSLGSPVLQLLLRLELTTGDETSKHNGIVFDRLLPDKDFEAESETGKWVSSLVYDSTGAHVVETLVKFLSGRHFKKMYKNLFKDRIGKLAKNEIASYVAMAIFRRVGKDDLNDAMNAIVSEIPGLVERNRLAVLRTLIEQASKRQVSMTPLKEAFTEVYGNNPLDVLPKLLQVGETEPSRKEGTKQARSSNGEAKSRANLQGSLLAQTMLEATELCDIIQQSLLTIDADSLIDFSKDPVASRVVQCALRSPQSQKNFLRSLIPRFYPSLCALAVDPAGSHVVDALWTATTTANVHFMKEKIVTTLLKNEDTIRDSVYGRNVWRNWSIDLFNRQPMEWQVIAKTSSTKADLITNDASQPAKSAIQLARERHALKAGKIVKVNMNPGQFEKPLGTLEA